MGVVGGCGSDDGGSDNGAPVISDLSADRDAILAETGVANLTASATDPDGDTLEFSWTVTLGTVAPGADAGTAVLTAPMDRGTATVTLTVTDGNGGEATDSIDVDIRGWVVPESAGGIPAGTPLQAISFADPDNGLAVGGDGYIPGGNVPYIFRYANGVWTDETVGAAGHLHALAAVAPDNMWTTGGGGLAFHFDGTEWTQFTVPGGCVHGMDAFSASDIWVTPAEGQPYMRRYTGGVMNDWAEYEAPSSSGMNGVSMVSDSDGWAVGNSGMVIRFNGTIWEQQDAGTFSPIKDVDMITADDGWMVGGNGVVLHWDGSAWTKVDTPAGTADLADVHALATDDVWVVGAAGMILHYDGTAWTQVPSPIAADLRGIDFAADLDGWIAAGDGTVLHLE